MFRRFVSFALIFSLLAACAPTPTPTPAGLRPIRLPMGYIPSVQYAPYYVAAEKGYFAEAGLEVTFDYSFETNGVQLVGANELPFAVASGEQVLLARAQGLPVVYVMAWFQQFPVALITRGDSGLTTPADLRGKVIGSPTLDGASYVGLRAVLAASGVRVDEVQVEAIGFNQAAALSAKQVDAAVVYANNEPIRLVAAGQALNVMPVSAFISLAANGLLTNEDLIAHDPALVRVFVRAFQRGLADAIANPEEAYTISQKYVDGLKDEAVEKQVLAASIEMWKAPHLGFSDPSAWANMQKTLLDAGLLKTPVDLEKAVTNEFVP